MSQNENDLQNDDLLSFLCSSCKSELRSIFSIGVPSYLNTSVSNISSIPCNSQVSEIAANDEINAAYHSLEKSEIIRNETRRDASSGTFGIQVQKVNDITYRHVYSFINLKNRTIIVDNSRNAQCGEEDSKLLFSSIESHNISANNASAIKPPKQIGEPALPGYSSEKLKLIHDVHEALFNNADVETTVASKALVDSRYVAKREAVDADLAERRRNVYQLASRVLKLSEAIRKIQSNVLSSKYQEGTNETKETSPTNEVSDVDSNVKSVAIQDSLMYTYNPFRMTGKHTIKRVYQKGAGTNKTKETSSINEVNDTDSNVKIIAIQDPLMYTYNPFQRNRKQEIKRVRLQD
ncbi:hypothetical protein DMN91_004771 [Ooceraea biroi]|uniref:Uncharacterized protein n=1 Tax=Ooceraea biroi TaxID=2015173 RepID=A0A3L8DQL5_OOCBI|nr:hypothetical protein DMN91_004771 [Ooceraea biroi]